MYGYNSDVLVIGDYYYLGSHVIGTERRTPEASKSVCYLVIGDYYDLFF